MTPLTGMQIIWQHSGYCIFLAIIPPLTPALISHPCIRLVAVSLHCSIRAIIQWSSFSMWLINIRIHLMTSRCMFLWASAEPMEHAKKRSDAFFLFFFFSFYRNVTPENVSFDCVALGDKWGINIFPIWLFGSRLGPPMRVWWTLKWPWWFSNVRSLQIKRRISAIHTEAHITRTY